MQRTQAVGVDLCIGAAPSPPRLTSALGCLAVCGEARPAETLAEEARRRWSAVLLTQHGVDDLETRIVGQGARLRVDGRRTVQGDGTGLEAPPQLGGRGGAGRRQAQPRVDVVAAQPGRGGDLHRRELSVVEPARRHGAPQLGEAGPLARLDVGLEPGESLQAHGVEHSLAPLHRLEHTEVGIGCLLDVRRGVGADVVSGGVEQLGHEPGHPLHQQVLGNTGAHRPLDEGEVLLSDGITRLISPAIEVNEISDLEDSIGDVPARR